MESPIRFSFLKNYGELILILLICAVPRLMTLRQYERQSGSVVGSHWEGDEIVFQTLVHQVERNVTHYTLRGTSLLQELPSEQYDTTLFFHPPIFVYLAAGWESFLGFPLPLFPVFLNLATIAIIFWIGITLFSKDAAIWAAFLFAVCPVSWYISQRIWIDNMLVFSVTTCIAVHLWACRLKTVGSYFLSGLTFTFCLLSKYPGIFILPAMFVISIQQDLNNDRTRKWTAFFLPFILIALPWLIFVNVKNGRILLNLSISSRFEFVQMAALHPWYFYFIILLTITPVYILGLLPLPAAERSSVRLPLIVWVVSFFVGMIAYGMMTGGYQTRYVAPAYPALALLTGYTIHQIKRSTGLTVAIIALVAYGIMNACIYAVNPLNHADFTKSAVEMSVELFNSVPKVEF